MRECSGCGGAVERSFRYCPWCAAPQRRKIVEFFGAHPAIAADSGKALRVSRYLGSDPAERHVRFSVWNETGAAEAAVSLEEAEARRLAGFVLEHGAEPARPRLLDALLGPLRR